MLQFRCSPVLKELLRVSLKRPLSHTPRYIASVGKPQCLSRDGQVLFTLKPVRNERAVLHTSAWTRALCTNTEGRLETVKKDDVVHEAATDKKAGIMPSLEDLLFYTIAEGQERISAHKFITELKATGLRTGDPRLKDCMDMLKVTLRSTSDGMLDRHLFKKCVQSNIVLLTQAFRKKFVIPDFMPFTSHIDKLYEKAKNLSGGLVADYIPQLAKFSPDLWGVALCTVDGQSRPNPSFSTKTQLIKPNALSQPKTAKLSQSTCP